MQVYFSTVVRFAEPNESGELVKLDWSTKQVLQTEPVRMTPPLFQDPNPRGNSRGGRGILVIGDEVVLAQYHTLRIFDKDLNHRRDLSHGLMVGLHEISLNPSDSNRIYVTSTAIDAVLEYTLNDGTLVQGYWPREMPGIAEASGVDPLPIDKQADNRTAFLDEAYYKTSGHLHLNAVTPHQGKLYALCNAHSTVLNLTDDQVAWKGEGMRHGHNLVFDGNDPDLFYVNDSRNGHVRRFSFRGQDQRDAVDLRTFSAVQKLVGPLMRQYYVKKVLTKLGVGQFPSVIPLFIRGLDRIDEHLFIGVSPATILQVHWPSGELVDHFTYTDNVRVAVHGLHVDRATVAN